MNKKWIRIEISDTFLSVNLQYKTVRRKNGYPMTFLTREAKAYKELVGWSAKRIFKGKPLGGRLEVSAWYFFAETFKKKKRDVLNDKITWDALEGIIYVNDNQICDADIHKRFTKNAPYSIIKIRELR